MGSRVLEAHLKDKKRLSVKGTPSTDHKRHKGSCINLTLIRASSSSNRHFLDVGGHGILKI